MNDIEITRVMNNAHAHFASKRLPGYMWGAVQRYLLKGIPPGDFLTCIISNDLKGAIGHADDANAQNIRNWVLFFYNGVPAGCWGSKASYTKWIKKGGLEGNPEEGDDVDE